MHLKPIRISPSVEWAILNTLSWVTAPLWAPFAGLIIAVCWLDQKFRPPRRYHRWFAWHPVKCDPWPEDGFKGTVWLETVWRTNTFHGVMHHREEPTERHQHWVRFAAVDWNPAREGAE